MSFIHCYYFAQSCFTTPPSHWDTTEMQRFEKILKLETTFQGVQLQRNSKDQFLTALKGQSALLRFLDAYPEFAQLFRSKTDLLKEYPECNYDGYSMLQLATEVEQNLSDDWIAFIIEELDAQRFYYLQFMLRYKALLPERVAQTLKNKLEAKLLQFDADLEVADSRVDWIQFKNYVDFIKVLNDKKLAQLVFFIENKRRRLLNETYEIINKPGIIHFFETMFGGIYYLFHHPDDAAGKRERKRVMGDFKFMGSILLGIVFLIVIGAYYGQHRKAEQKKQVEADKIGVFPSLYYYKENDIQLGARFSDTLRSGYDFLQNKYLKPDAGALTFINSTPFEVVLFTNSKAVDAFFSEPTKRNAAKHFVWIQSKDTAYFPTHGMPFHLYVGKQLTAQSASSAKKDAYPRFLNPFEGISKFTAFPIEMGGKYMELKGTNFELILRADQTFFVNGQSKESDTIYNLFKN